MKARRAVHGRPVWRHESGDRFIAELASGYWAVLEEGDVGVNEDVFLRLSDVNVLFLHQLRGVGGAGRQGWVARRGRPKV